MDAAAAPHADREFGIRPEEGVRTNAEAFHKAKLTYSIAETCQALGVKTTTVYDLIASGRLKKVKLGARSLVPADSLHALVASLTDSEAKDAA